jgi:tRNA(Ile)-lysidine synthetase-like protein
MNFYSAVLKTIVKNSLWDFESRLLLAVSGGRDSMAMFHTFIALTPEPEKSLIVAHIDHGIRPESADDAAFVEDISCDAGVPFVCIKLPSALPPENCSPEQFWRCERYRLLKQIQLSCGAKAIATAHTATDHLETLLLRISSGTGPRGFLGIRLKRMDGVIRPLLNVTRWDVADFADTSGLSWRDDVSNYDDSRPRNALRKHVVPVLRNLNPSVEALSVTASNLLADEDAYMSRQALLLLERADWKKTLPAKLDSAIFQTAAEPIIRRSATALYHDIAPKHRLSHAHVTALSQCLKGESRKCPLPKDMLACHSNRHNSVFLIPFVTPEDRFCEVSLSSEGNFIVGAFKIGLKKIAPNRIPSREVAATGNPVLRTRRANDVYLDFTNGIEIRLSEFFRTENILVNLRPILPLLVCNQNRVLWVADPFTKSQINVFIRKNTVFRLTCNPLSAIK